MKRSPAHNPMWFAESIGHSSRCQPLLAYSPFRGFRVRGSSSAPILPYSRLAFYPARPLTPSCTITYSNLLPKLLGINSKAFSSDRASAKLRNIAEKRKN
jgi:hypothetical protein